MSCLAAARAAARRPISGLVLVVVAYVETYTCVSCRLVAPWCVGGGVMERRSSPRSCCVSVEAAGLRGGALPSRLANSPGQTHQRDQRQAHASNSSGAASRAGGVSLLFSSVAHASQMTAHRPRQGAGGHRHAARRRGGTGAQVGTSRTAEQARPPTQHGDVRQHQGRHGPTPPTSCGRTAPRPIPSDLAVEQGGQGEK